MYINIKLPLLILISLIIYSSCAYDGEIHVDMDSLYPENQYKGWQLNEYNTGLCENYDDLEVIDASNAAEYGSIINNTLIITVPGVTISRKRINYMVLNQTTGVTIEHCLIRPLTCGSGVPIVNISKAIIRDSEVDCSAIPLAEVGFSIIVNGEDCIVERCNIHGGSTGISIHNTSDNTMVSVAQGNYVHGLRYYDPTPADPDNNDNAHVDGLTIRESSGAGVIVRNNYIKTEELATGAFFMQAYRGYINNVLAKGNFLQGYGYCISIDYNNHGYGYNIWVVNNRFDAWTIYGGGPAYESYSGGPGWHIWTDNYVYKKPAVDYRGVEITP